MHESFPFVLSVQNTNDPIADLIQSRAEVMFTALDLASCNERGGGGVEIQSILLLQIKYSETVNGDLLVKDVGDIADRICPFEARNHATDDNAGMQRSSIQGGAPDVIPIAIESLVNCDLEKRLVYPHVNWTFFSENFSSLGLLVIESDVVPNFFEKFDFAVGSSRCNDLQPVAFGELDYESDSLSVMT